MIVNVTYYGMEGSGRNVTEAKRDAGAKIESAMKGNYQPRVVASRGIALLVWRDPYGWRSSILTDGLCGDDKGSATGFREELSYCSGREDFHETYADALLNLAQLSWDEKELLPPCLENVARLAELGRGRDNLGRRLLGEFSHWRGFQLAYKVARAQGMGDCDAHRWACERSSEYADKPAA